MLLTTFWIDEILVLLAFALPMNLLVGYAGVFALVPPCLGAIGAEAFVVVQSHFGLGFIGCVLVSAVVTAIFAVVVILPALRLNVTALVIFTVAFLEIAGFLLGKLQLFGRSYPVTVDNISVFGWSFHLGQTPQADLPILAGLCVVVFAVCWRFGESPFGRVLRGIREDEMAARSLGRTAVHYKVVVLAVSGALAALVGSVLVMINGITEPDLTSFSTMATILTIVVIGGRGSLVGTVVGATVLELMTPFLEHVVRVTITDAALMEECFAGLALVAILLIRPRGLVPEGVLPRRNVTRRRVREAARLGEPELVSVPAMALAFAGGALQPAAAMPRSFPRSHDGRSSGELRSQARALPDSGAEVGLPGTDVVLQVIDLSKSFGGVLAVDGLTVGLRHGMVTALVGPNGAGKTTMFNLVTGALRADHGRVILGGQDVTGASMESIARRGVVRSFQDVRLFDELTVRENVMLGIQHHPGESLEGLFVQTRRAARFERAARAQALDWLGYVGMAAQADTRAKDVSFGEQKLVAIARVLATEAEVLLLDEPASGVDHAWVDRIMALIARIRDSGHTVCLIEHDLHVVGQLADHVCFMELGRVTAEGALADLIADPRLAEAYFGAE